MSDPYDLQRFLDAQAPVYDQALAELRAGRKTSHWMWFVFPQLKGLGRSETAKFYAISGAAEAEAYLEHPILGKRLRDCVETLLTLPHLSANEIFDSPDDLKLHSSLTLFAQVAEAGSVFQRLLQQLFRGEPDPKTLFALRA